MLPRTILIIDDNEDFRFTLEDILRRAGYTVIGAEDGYGGLAQLATGKMPSLIITDIHMPRLDGLRFLKALRNESQYKAVPVLICSGDSAFEDLPIDLGDVRSSGKNIEGIVSLVQKTNWK